MLKFDMTLRVLKEKDKYAGIAGTSSRVTSGPRCALPFFSVPDYMVVYRITYGIGGWLLRTGRIDETTAFLCLTMAGARSGLETIVTLNLTFLVFTFGSLLVAIQVAGGQ